MNILTITTWDSHGEQFNGYQIHRELILQGNNSDMAVFVKEKKDPHIHALGTTFSKLFDKTITRIIEGLLGLWCLFPISGLCLLFKKYYWNADVIHLQIIHGDRFFSLLLLPLLSMKHKIVWTLHDPWVLTGHCIYPMNCRRWMVGCGKCPNLSVPIQVRCDSTRFMYKIKKWILNHSCVELIVASEWMHNLVKASPLVSHLPCHVIPLGIDVEKFRPKNKAEIRKKFNFPSDAHVLAFRFTGEQDQFKGWPYIKEALNILNLTRPTYIIVIQKKGAAQHLDKKFTCIELGWTEDQEVLIDALNAADIFLMPSVAEAFGMMAVESMACGTPVVVFEGTSLPGVIHAPVGGVAVPYKDANALARAIEELLGDPVRYDKIVRKGLEIVQEEYSADKYLKSHIDLYNVLISSSL